MTTPVTQLWIKGELTLVNIPTEIVQELYHHCHGCRDCIRGLLFNKGQGNMFYQPSRWCPTAMLLIEMQLQAGDANAPSGR